MQISATTSITPTLPLDRQSTNTPAATGTPATTKQQQQDQATTVKASKAAEQESEKVFTPAPPLRPNIQDYVDINRTLIMLRKM